MTNRQSKSRFSLHPVILSSFRRRRSLPPLPQKKMTTHHALTRLLAQDYGREIGFDSVANFSLTRLRAHCPETAQRIEWLKNKIETYETGSASYLAFVEGSVFPCGVNSGFYFEDPFDRLLYKMGSTFEPHLTLTTSVLTEDEANWFHNALTAGANHVRVVLMIHSRLRRFHYRDGINEGVLSLLEMCARGDVNACNLVADASLFELIAMRLRDDFIPLHAAVSLARTEGIRRHSLVIMPIVSHCCATLATCSQGQWTAHDPCQGMVTSVYFLVELMNASSTWHELLTCDLCKWLPRVALTERANSLLVASLRVPSVQMVLALHESEVLDSLIAHAHQSEWHVTLSILRDQWPQRVSRGCGTCDETGGGDAGTALRDCGGHREDDGGLACPITLMPFSRPVVASDGHVYERDALMEHLSRYGCVSPMTKGTLRYDLFEVYPIRHGRDAICP
jgi:hypothetical protein